MHTVGPKIWRETLKSMESEKCTLQDLDYGEKTENHGKLETRGRTCNMVRNTQKSGKREMHTVVP